MNFSKNNFPFFKLAGVAVLLTTVIIGSSWKHDDGFPPSRQAKVKVINGIFNRPGYVIKVNGKELNTAPLAYRKSTAYTEVPASNTALLVTEQSSKNVVISGKLNIAAGTNSSLYLVPASATSKATTLVIKDDLTTIAPGKAKIRFVNLSPDAEKLDLLLNGKSVASTTGTGFQKFSNFVEIAPVAGATFELRETGTTNIVASATNVSVAEGQFTTLWAVGTKARSASPDAKLALGVIVNKPAN